MSYDPFKMPKDNICYRCKNKERKNSMLTGIGIYCTSYKSRRQCITGGIYENECRGFEKREDI